MAASVNRTENTHREKVQKVFIQRDYSEGTNVKFQTKFPSELDGLIDRHLFEQTINTLNRIYAEAEKTSATTFCESCLACLTSYVIYLCVETHYQKCLKRISNYLDEQNETVWLPRGLLITDPIERGLRAMPHLFEGICPLFTQQVFQNCKDAEIRTVTDFILKDPEDLAKKIKVPFKDVFAIHRALLVQFSGFPQSASSLYSDLVETISILNTGSKRLNKFLNGGIYTGEVTEVYGKPGSGKTQLCLSLASNLILESKNTILYVDTSGNFVGKWLEEILLKSCDLQDTISKMENVKVKYIYNVFELFDCLDAVKHSLEKQEQVFFKYLKLLVIDSITPLLAPCLSGKYGDGLGFMSNLAQQMLVLCSEFKLSIVVCNNTVQGKDMALKPALGLQWKYVPSVSLCIEKLSDSPLHKIKAVKSCRSALFEDVMFQITESGISN